MDYILNINVYLEFGHLFKIVFSPVTVHCFVSRGPFRTVLETAHRVYGHVCEMLGEQRRRRMSECKRGTQEARGRKRIKRAELQQAFLSAPRTPREPQRAIHVIPKIAPHIGLLMMASGRRVENRVSFSEFWLENGCAAAKSFCM